MQPPWGVGKINSDQQEAKDWYTAFLKNLVAPKDSEVKEVLLNPKVPDIKMLLGVDLDQDLEQHLTNLLKNILVKNQQIQQAMVWIKTIIR